MDADEFILQAGGPDDLAPAVAHIDAVIVVVRTVAVPDFVVR
jgi:hypothetical protein